MKVGLDGLTRELDLVKFDYIYSQFATFGFAWMTDEFHSVVLRLLLYQDFDDF